MAGAKGNFAPKQGLPQYQGGPDIHALRISDSIKNKTKQYELPI